MILIKFTGMTQDGKPLRKIPYIGKMNEQEYVAYAYNKWGMTLSMLLVN